ncbi:uncharacterized protein N7498_010019 [Penicillium cinerascens]|uniref:Uncharacterized protein n=1 Tax=Penicillium cinerascens TaxID=70096 RepID=A0A9W9M6Z8_9EURO|nr:uncharacterized protein N7498_010019 [Penicillium cinerascens]KAJ5191034.1 hypothetical protein N7498_010019 [Penicillium cinerascens]
MSQSVNLGRCVYHATDSHLELEFSAIALFTKSNGHPSNSLPVNFLQWTDHLSVWIKEAPELEIRLSIVMRSGLKLAASGFISDLAEKICNSKVWSNLGFTIILKTRGSDKHTDNCIAHCFTFGLCRATRRLNPTKGRALPDVLRHPPDAHAPPDVPTISLASIDVYAEYTFPHPKENTCRTIQYNVGPLNQLQLPFPFAGCYYPVNAKTFEVAAISLSPVKAAMPSAKHYTFLENHALGQLLPPHVPLDCTSEVMLRLMDLGLRKLIISPTTKDRQIKVVGENTLKSLSNLAPAVFNPGYREAMHQRAASNPIISKALISMLERSSNPIIQSKVTTLLQQSNNPNEGTPQPGLHKTSLYSTIHSSLWRIAQQRTRRPKVQKGTSALFGANPATPYLSQIQPASIAPIVEDFFSDSEPLDLDSDNYNPMEHGYMQFAPEDEDLLLESGNESAFEDLYDSAPTALDDTFQYGEPCLLLHSDTEMLPLDHDILDI